MTTADRYDLSDDERHCEREEDGVISNNLGKLEYLLERYEKAHMEAITKLNDVYWLLKKMGIAYAEEVGRSHDLLDGAVLSADDIRDGLLYQEGIEVESDPRDTDDVIRQAAKIMEEHTGVVIMDLTKKNND